MRVNPICNVKISQTRSQKSNVLTERITKTYTQGQKFHASKKMMYVIIYPIRQKSFSNQARSYMIANGLFTSAMQKMTRTSTTLGGMSERK